MGMASSKDHPDFDMRRGTFPWEQCHPANRKPQSEEEEAFTLSTASAIERWLTRELDVMFMTKPGESPPPKEIDPEREAEANKRFCEFMKAGACKETFKAIEDCAEKTGRALKCYQHFPILIKCVDAHSDYYKPVIALAETAMEKVSDEIVGYYSEKLDVATKWRKKLFSFLWSK